MEASLLGLGAGSWNVAVLVMVGVVVLALCLLAAAATGVILVQRKEAVAQSRALDEYMAEASQKIAEARALAARSVERAASANERAAKLEREAEELRSRNTALQHEAKVATAAAAAQPSREEFLVMIAKAPPGRIDISSAKDCAQCEWLAGWLSGLLHEAGWHVKGAEPLGKGAPPPASADQAWRINVVGRQPERPEHEKSLRPFDAVMAGLAASLGGAAELMEQRDAGLADDHVKVAIAPRH